MNGKIRILDAMLSTVAVVCLLAAASPAMAAKPGPAKPSGAVTGILEFNGEWSLEVPVLEWEDTVPFTCQTEEHLAGENEIAIVNMGGFYVTNTQNAIGLWLRVAVSNDGINFSTLTPEAEALSTFANGVASLSVSRTLQLEAGKRYTFGAAFQSIINPVHNTWARCSGTVQIVRM